MKLKFVMLILSGLVMLACAGPTGPVGATGAQGVPGAAVLGGSSCSAQTIQASDAAPNGGGLVTCTDGSTVLLLNGTNGAQGQQGIVPFTPIEFCPGTIAVYPSVFPEYGFLINGSVYGVYSTNGGFLTVLPPGVYNSNAVGSACTFTINSDGTVTE